MSFRGLNPPMDTFSIEVVSNAEDKRKGIGDYHVARSLLKSIILWTDVQNFEELIHHVDHFAEVIRKGEEDLKEKMKRLYPNLNLGLLESNDEAKEVEDREVQMDDLFNPTHEDHIAEDVTSAPPPAVIVLPNQAEVDEFGAPKGAM
ncbi:hypothetical protein COCNU_02G002430 [Cocos nucifera]|uniref:Uncharacterized protein n=1 Tax=Cocos nucifera TaxID=13894 RepID=A0A8K0MVZ6_COCNU|nr:hypothetical protein COCNU_02G002430 [Cocos nucifera]